MNGNNEAHPNISTLLQKGKGKISVPSQKGQKPKLTRGFIRAQRKGERLREIAPDDALIVGMDLAHKHHCVWISNVQKEPLDRLRIENVPLGMDALIMRAQEVQRKHQLGKIVFGMEPTGHYWMSVATYLAHQNLPYVLVQPLSVKRERESTYYRYAKSDFRDAELIANLVADRKFTFTQLPPDPLWASLKTMATEFIMADMMMVAEKMRIHSLLERLYPEYPAVFKDVTGLTALSCLLSMRDLPDATQAEFLAEVRSQCDRRLSVSKVSEFYELVTSYPRDWGAPVYEEGLRVPIAHAAERYKLLESQNQEAERKLLALYAQTGYAPYADTIPNVPSVLHAAVLGLTGNPGDYDSSRCITKFAGVDIKENQSGNYRGQTTITYRGAPLLRYIAYLCGFILKTHNHLFSGRYYYLTSRQQRPLKKNQAIVALGCKYLRILWTLCTERTFYDEAKAKNGVLIA